MKNKFVSIALLVLAVCALLFACTLGLPGDDMLTGEIHNGAHVPVFGMLALTILGLSRLLLRDRIRKTWIHYLFAFVVTAGIGAMLEFLQIVGPRDADPWDLVRDIAGALSFLGVYLTFDTPVRAVMSKATLTAIRYLSILIFLGSLVPLGWTAGAYLHRDSNFPRLLTFDSIWESRFLTTRSAEITRVPEPVGFTTAESHSVGKLTMFPGEYCGFRIAEPCPDWSGHEYLRFDLLSEIDSTITLAVRIDDLYHNQEYEDRYNAGFEIKRGLNRVSIDLHDVRTAPSSREMNMTAIRYIYFFTYKPKEDLVLYVDNVRLE